MDETAARQKLLKSIHDLGDVAAGSAQVAVLNGAVDIYHPAHVVVRYNFHLSGSGNRSDVCQNLRTNHARSAESYVLQVLKRLDLILRCLRDHRVLHAVLPVQEECRRSLEAAAE